jgi:hypothetical protein
MALFPAFNNHEIFISVYCKDRQKAKPARDSHDHRSKPRKRAQVDDIPVKEGWWDPVTGGSWFDLDADAQAARIASGDHIVPGTHGGIPWVQHIHTVEKKLHWHRMNGHIFEVGDNSIIRVSIRRLRYHAADRGWIAGVKRMFAMYSACRQTWPGRTTGYWWTTPARS